MKIEDLFLITGFGWLDWAKVGLKGRHTNICFTIYEFRKNKRKKNGQLYKTVKKRLTKKMSIRLGLTLTKPMYMPILVHELLMINENNKIGLERTTRLELGRTITHFYSGSTRSKFSPDMVKLFLLLKEKLSASHLNCWIDCYNPSYIEITATIERRTFNFPARFLINLVKVLNLHNKGGSAS
jgi:hypothetical protein